MAEKGRAARPPRRDAELVAQGKCGRRRKKGRGYCRRDAPAAGGACYLHGKDSPKGVDHWNYGGKGFSKYDTPEKIRAWFEAFLEDPDISLRGDIALTRALIQSTLEDLEAGVARGWRASIAGARDRMRSAIALTRGGQVDRGNQVFEEAMRDLGELVEQGARIDHAAAELRGHQRMLREMVDTEVRRLKFEGVPAEEVVAFGFQLMRLCELAIGKVGAGMAPGQAKAEMVQGFRSLVGGEDAARPVH